MVTTNSPGESPTVEPASGRLRGLLDRHTLLQRLLNPIDIASIVFFRIAFGLIAFYHIWLQMRSVRAVYIDPVFHYKYPGFGWVQPLPGELMYVVFLVLAACAICVALGFFYRFAITAFFLLHTYVLLVDQSAAWNHYYFITLLAFLLIFVPANRAFSLDVARGVVTESDEIPSWCLWILRAQLGIVYFFAGLAKLSSHDWLHARPMDMFLNGSTEFPLVGRWFNEQWMHYAASYAGMCFDILIVPLMLWRRTRPLGLLLAVFFHLSNSLIFNIQVFPFLALAATLLFLSPSWPRLGGQWRRFAQPVASTLRASPRLSIKQKAVAGLLGVYFLIQVLLPLRHFAFTGNAEWTRLGEFHAWRMLLSQRKAEVAFFLTSKDPEAICEIDLTAYLYPNQIGWLSYPDGAVQFARYIGEKYRERGASDFEIHAWTSVEFNGRDARALIKPDVDLLSVSRPIGRASWLFDLEDAVPVEKPVADRCPDPAPILRLKQLDDYINDLPQPE